MASSPSFPKGLRVLLVDCDSSRATVQAQLQQPELQYAVTAVSSAAQALGFLRTGVAAFDVVLADSRMVASDEAVGRSFIDSFEETPVVLMSDSASTDDVMRAVQLGAVDFLDKPLSLLKLKNIWQHSVRKMMLKAAGPRRAAPSSCACVSVSVAPAPLVAPALAVPPSPWTSLAAVKPAPAPAGGTAAAPPPSATPALSSMPSLAAPESPGTPSALSGADMPETFSMCSSGLDSGAASLRTSLDAGDGSSESFMEALNSAINGTGAGAGGAPLPRPTSFTSLPSSAAPAPAAAAASVAPVAPQQWPALTPGCVWGTPAGGPVPPPLPSAPSSAWGPLQPSYSAPAPVLIKSSTPAPAPVLPAPVPAATHNAVAPPEGFLLNDLLAPRPGGSGGPLGLKLRKSPSLLNLINSALSTDAPSCPGSMGLAPMLF